jgi:hypothetical protein
VAAAEAGFTCFRARASELERDFAYGCVRQLLEPAVAKLSDPERDRLFDGAASLSKPLFAPTDASSPSADSSFSILHGLYWLLNNLADEGPVALYVDDLQWSDPESIPQLPSPSHGRPPGRCLRFHAQRRERPGGPGSPGRQPRDNAASAWTLERRSNSGALRA